MKEKQNILKSTNEGLLAQSHCKHLKDGFCKACKEDFMRDFSEPKVSLLAHHKKLYDKYKDEFKRFQKKKWSKRDMETTVRLYGQIGTDLILLEKAVLGVAQQIQDSAKTSKWVEDYVSGTRNVYRKGDCTFEGLQNISNEKWVKLSDMKKALLGAS